MAELLFALLGGAVWVGGALFTLWLLSRQHAPSKIRAYEYPLRWWAWALACWVFLFVWPHLLWILLRVRWEKRG